MYSVRLHVGNLGLSGLSGMLPNLDGLIERTRQAFSSGSGGDIDIEIVPGVTNIDSSLTTDTFALHQAAENLTGNDPTVPGPIKDISLIFAGSYAPDGNVLP